MVAIAAMVVNFLPVMWYRRNDIPVWGDAAYAGLHRHVYSICASWLIFVCATGNASKYDGSAFDPTPPHRYYRG